VDFVLRHTDVRQEGQVSLHFLAGCAVTAEFGQDQRGVEIGINLAKFKLLNGAGKTDRINATDSRKLEWFGRGTAVCPA